MGNDICDHSLFGETLRLCIECKCAGCGQIKFRKQLEEIYVNGQTIVKKE